MARDFWNTKQLAVKIDKIKKSLTIPAASYICCFPRASIYTPVSISPPRLASNITLSAVALTIDFWAKFLQTAGTSSGTYLDALALIDSGGTREIRLKLESANTRVVVTTSGGTFTLSIPQSYYYYTWRRFTITFSEADGLLKFYVDTVLQGQIAIVGNLTNNTFSFRFGQADFLGQVVHFVNELAFYDVAKTQEQIIQTNSFKGNIGVYGLNLIGYWKINNLVTNISTPSVGVINLIVNATTSELRTDEYAPVKFGSSFVVAQANFSLGYRCSLRFPTTPPSGTTGMFVVRWVDEDGVIQRRKLWSLEGVDIAPSPNLYSGEAVSENFTLEFWNIDGQETAVIPEDIEFRVSKTTDPISSFDVTPIVAAVVTVDSTLAAVFPISFPLTFNQQQSYIP